MIDRCVRAYGFRRDRTGGGGSVPRGSGPLGELYAWFKPGIGLWQDTSRTIPAQADGDPVAVWDDLSATSSFTVYQYNDTSRPTLRLGGQGGYPYLVFDGMDDDLSSSMLFPITGSAQFVFFVVWRPASTTVPMAPLGWGTWGPFPYSGVALMANKAPAGQGILSVDFVDNPAIFGSFGGVIPQAQATVVRYTGGAITPISLRLWRNGVEQTMRADSTTITPALEIGPLWIGATPTGVYHGPMEIYEIGIYNRFLDNDQILLLNVDLVLDYAL